MTPSPDAAPDVVANLEHVRGRIARAAQAAGREPGSVRLVAVSKTVDAERARAAVAAGVRWLGENRAQELTAKAALLAERDGPSGTGGAETRTGAETETETETRTGGAPGSASAPRWAMLGPIQTNKARDVARWADEVQSLDRPEVAQALQRRLDAAERSLDVMIQVNTSGEASKSGVSPEGLMALARGVARFDRLRLTGLMTIATRGGDEAEARRCFALLRGLREQVRAEVSGAVELSMGMSGDLEWAIAEGATVVRVGSAIFGARPPAVSEPPR